jgi:hypothetical protein
LTPCATLAPRVPAPRHRLGDLVSFNRGVVIDSPGQDACMSDARIIEGIELKSNALVGELDERGGVGAGSAAKRDRGR